MSCVASLSLNRFPVTFPEKNSLFLQRTFCFS